MNEWLAPVQESSCYQSQGLVFMGRCYGHSMGVCLFPVLSFPVIHSLALNSFPMSLSPRVIPRRLFLSAPDPTLACLILRLHG